MARICETCGKGNLKGNLVPRGIGNRVTRRTITHKRPNLRVKRIKIGSTKIKLKLCASCLKKLKKEGVIKPYSAAK